MSASFAPQVFTSIFSKNDVYFPPISPLGLFGQVMLATPVEVREGTLVFVQIFCPWRVNPLITSIPLQVPQKFLK